MTTPTTPVRQPGDPIPPPPEPRYPWRVGVTMLGLVALVLVVVWLAFQAVKGPATTGEFPSAPTATAIAQSFQATVAAADTAQPRPTRQPTPQLAAQPAAAPAGTVAPTRAPTALSAPALAPTATPKTASAAPTDNVTQPATVPPASATSAPTSAPTRASLGAGQPEPVRTADATAGTGTSATPTAWPTVAPELVQTVSDAYIHYWQVVEDTALSLDPAPLDQVAAGDQLAALKQSIESDRASNHATRMDTAHNFVIISASDNQAQVADRLHYAYTVVDADTHEPLPDQTQPTSADQAPETDAIVDLQRIDGAWKVVYAAKAVEGNTP